MLKFLTHSIVLAAAFSANGNPIHTGLLNYWNLDGNANDTGSNYTGATGVTTDNGNVNGTVTFTKGKFGQAGNFLGGPGNHITIPDGGTSASQSLANDIDRNGADMSLSVWIKPRVWNQPWQTIVAHGEGSDYRLARSGDKDPIRYSGVAGSMPDIVSSSIYGGARNVDNLWHHIILTSENGGESKLYIDGVLEGTNSHSAAIKASLSNKNVLCIGCNPDNGREFAGLIDDIGLWDRALTAEEVSAIHTAGINGKPLGAIPEPSVGLILSFASALIVLRRQR